MAKQFHWQLLSCVAGLAMTPTLAYAQSQHEAPQAKDAIDNEGDIGDIGDIVVTGSRIRRDGYDAPVPVNVLGTEEIAAQRPANITDLINDLPSVASGAVSPGGLSRGDGGIRSIDLRNLGAVRTLVLLNGQRTVASTFTGTVDINTFPQDLIQRVEIVTGGASAQYGSDAVGGVVNFILDEGYKGIKLGADSSITTYGDGLNYRFTGTAGLSLLDDRLHILTNAEYFKQEGIDSVGDRSWNNSGYFLIDNPNYAPANGQPEFIVRSGIGRNDRTKGGLVTSGPLRGTYFLEDGAAGRLNYGVISGASMIGGDWQITNDGAVGTQTLLANEERIGTFNRIAFDITPDITIFGQFSWNRWEGQQHYGAWQYTANIQSDNAFLLAQYPQVAAAMQANGLSSIPIGYWGNYVIGSNNSREVYRYTAGAKGKFTLGSRPWSWDVYYHHGITKTHEETAFSGNSARRLLGIDAVLSNGQTVCRSTLTNPTNGCVPIDVLGPSGPSDAQLGYLFGPEQPWREQRIKMDVAAATLGGELFDLPGGPVAIALGGEWRKEQINGEVGATSSSGWIDGGNYRVNRGKINVKEVFAEVSLPVFTGLDINAAGRLTDYSTSGGVQTWKIGGTYTPIPDVKFRGTYSRDIRAPNMQELFLGLSTFQDTIRLPANSPTPGEHFAENRISGNPNLKPEKANTWTAGVVMTPSFVPGFSASVDYWNVKIADVIGSISQQQTVDFCYGGFPNFCDNIVFSGGVPIATLLTPVNFAKRHTTGIDIEASYRTPLSAISSNLPGDFRIHAAITHYIKDVVDNLVFPVDNAGAGLPSWEYRVSAVYDIDPVSINLVARGSSARVYRNEWIECTSGCPLSTVQNRTINDNHIDGSMYVDGSVSVKIRPFSGNETKLNFIVRNMFNKDPAPFGNSTGDPSSPQATGDLLGRVFRIALTTKF